MNSIFQIRPLSTRIWWSGEIELDCYGYYQAGWNFPWILGSNAKVMLKDE